MIFCIMSPGDQLSVDQATYYLPPSSGNFSKLAMVASEYLYALVLMIQINRLIQALMCEAMRDWNQFSIFK